MIKNNLKKCPKCSGLQHKDNYFSNKARPDKLSSWCKKCTIKDTYERSLRPENEASKKYTSILHNCKKRRINVELSRNEFVCWYNSTEHKCIYCGITQGLIKKLNWNPSFKNQSKTMSIDRVDNNKNYSINNIVMSCLSCNVIKGTKLSFNEMVEIGEKYLKNKWMNEIA